MHVRVRVKVRVRVGHAHLEDAAVHVHAVCGHRCEETVEHTHVDLVRGRGRAGVKGEGERVSLKAEVRVWDGCGVWWTLRLRVRVRVRVRGVCQAEGCGSVCEGCGPVCGLGPWLASTASSRVWVPASTRSGSTMGTMPSLWQMRAYRACSMVGVITR